MGKYSYFTVYSLVKNADSPEFDPFSLGRGVSFKVPFNSLSAIL